MSEEVTAELRQQILHYLSTVSKAKNRNVARAINVEKAKVDKAINELAREGKIEFLYLGTSYVRVKED